MSGADRPVNESEDNLPESLEQDLDELAGRSTSRADRTIDEQGEEGSLQRGSEQDDTIA